MTDSTSQLPDHYRILGVALFERDPDVIAKAADQRTAQLQSLLAGEQGVVAQRTLTAIAAAKACLLDSGNKAAYDRQLRKKLISGIDDLPPPAEADETPPELPATPTTPTAIPGTAASDLLGPSSLEQVPPLPPTETEPPPVPSEPPEVPLSEPSPVSSDSFATPAKQTKDFASQAEELPVIPTTPTAVAATATSTGRVPEPRKRSSEPPEAPLSEPSPVSSDSFATPAKEAFATKKVLPRKRLPVMLVLGFIVCAVGLGTVAYFWSHREIAQVKPSPTPPVVPQPPPEPKPTPKPPPAPINLLALLKPIKQHTISGTWRMEQGNLHSVEDSIASIQVPFQPPRGYLLKLVVERKTEAKQGQAALILEMVAQGQPFSVILDHDGDETRLSGSGGLVHKGTVLTQNEQKTLECTCRRDSLVVTMNGKKLIDWHGDFKTLATTGEPSIRIVSRRSHFIISKMELWPDE